MPDDIVQKQCTEIYFLFPEYIDETHVASAPYIHDMSYGFEEDTPAFVTALIDTLRFITYERVDKYYDGRNVDGMLYPYAELGYPSVEYTVRTSLRDYDVLDWREELGEDSSEIEWRNNIIVNDICSKVHERECMDKPEIKVHAALFVVEHAIEGEGDAITFNCHGRPCTLVYQTTLRGLCGWLSDNRIPARRFKYCDKHGENGRGGWFLPDGTHTALLDSSCEHAQTILNKAIGERTVSNDLWYYDSQYGKMLYFEYQNDNPQNEYHGYHLSKGDKGYDKINTKLLCMIQDDIPEI